MSDPSILAAASGALATLAIVLGAACVRWTATDTLLDAVLIPWRALPAFASRLTVAGLLAGAVMSGLSISGSGSANTDRDAVLAAVASGSARLPAGSADETESYESVLPAGEKERALGALRNYVASIKEKQASISGMDGANASGSQKALADVDTMISRLAKRLETEPNNFDGWKMLGWSYSHTGETSNAIAAYERALALAPDNAEVKSALEEARRGVPAEKPAEPTQAAGGVDLPQSEMINGMVERLAARLESNPKDEDGWLRLMKSRVVLGQQDLAREALRKALQTFEGDQAAKTRIADAAKALGL